ncbi:3-beta hydroxysteroid dehydrogenase/isomerase [Macleaya cordata]|uniref:Reticulon-like protein n=1 Tax=Macleaya cordata TaxID=56857 RepID=A0A200QKX4_MACCD|nr:3-beta hydroxysteroid dehydrogenase/isomerase [Macleaya cordata]
MAIGDDSRDENPKICVVLGGQSFIGKSLVSQILKSENWIVRIADSAPSLNLDPKEQSSFLSDAISSGLASYFQVDVREKSQIIRAVEGSTVVFHIDQTDSSLNDIYIQYMTIIQGTKNVINACRECKVKRLIYNSSADVVFDGSRDIQNGDESLPYPWRFQDMLSDFKAQAEALVLFANTTDGLLTCALRPSSAFGPEDTHLIPFIRNAARSGLAKFIVGNGENMCDFTYVDNIAHAHVCAEKSLCSGLTSVAGKAFFITNVEPMKFWDFVSLILEGLGYRRPAIQLPARLVSVILVLINLVGNQRNSHLVLTPSMIHALSRTRTFSCSKAQNHIGYSPIVSLEEGVALTIQSFSHLAEDSPYSRYQESSDQTKADKLLGSGRVASILLWRDEKKTFTYFLTLVVLFYWFVLSGRNFISSAAKLLLLVTAVLYSLGKLPSSMFGFTVRRMHPSHFQVSETVTKDLIISLASAWNRWVLTLRSFAHGDDWNTFFKVTVSLYFFKLLLSLSSSAVIGIALVFAFTAFFVYEQYEEEVDRVTEVAFIGIKNSKRLLVGNLPVSVASILQSYQILCPDEGSIVVNDQKH